jgi:CheY-like chemotaxis protein/two-component sensor histidine kinase
MENKKQKILIVDDEKGMLNVIKGILDDAGYESFLAEDGLRGLTMAKAVTPDLILSDIQMPSMNGYELLHALKDDPALANIPFVFMTGVNVGQQDQRLGMGLGADDYLTKPFSDEELIGAVESRLRKKQLWQQFVDSTIQKTHVGFFLLLSNELQMRVMDILESAQSLATDSTVTKENIQKASRQITVSAKRLNRLHENIMFYSLLQMWVKDPEKIASLRKEVTVSYLSILQSIVLEHTRESGRKDPVTTACSDAALQISPVDFGKIMSELIDNAGKNSPPGTPIKISSGEENGRVLISVYNEGAGMTQEQIDGIVSLMADDLQEFRKEGSGLGLTIVKTLTGIYDGTFSIKSTAKEGTVVTVSIPKVKNL